MTTPTTITFTPPLPCSVLGESGTTQCGKPATAGTLYPMGGGQYILQPICRDCVAAIRWLYIDPAGERPTTTPEEAGEQARQSAATHERIRMRGFEG